MVTLEEVKATYTDEKKEIEKNRWVLRYILRPMSFYMAPGWLMFTPNQVTMTGFFFGLVGIFHLLIASYTPTPVLGILVGVVFLFSRSLMECVDGTVARLRNMYSKRGELLDETTGYIIHAGLMVAIGVVGGNILVGAISAMLVLLYYLFKYSYSRISAKTMSSFVNPNRFIFALGFNLWDITSLLPIGIIPFALLGRMDLMVWYCFVLNFVVFIFTYVKLIRGSEGYE